MEQYSKTTKMYESNMVPMDIGPVQMYAGLFRVSKTASNALNKLMKMMTRPDMVKTFTPEVMMHLISTLGEHCRQPAIIFNDFVRAANKSPEHQETLKQIMHVAQKEGVVATEDITQQEYQEIRVRLLQKLREPEPSKEENETKVISGN